MKNKMLDINLIDYNKSMSENAKITGFSVSTLKRRLVELGLYNNFVYCNGKHTSSTRGQLMVIEYNKYPKKCKCCGTDIEYKKKRNNYCSIKCSARTNNEERIQSGYTVSDEVKKVLSEKNKQKWKSGRFDHLIKEKIRKVCQTCEVEFNVVPSDSHRMFCSRKCSDNGKDMSHTGGIREGSGRGKSGWYKGYYCSSSWELAWVIFSLEHDVKFSRNLEGFEYTFSNKTHKFFPDFKLEDNSYVEVKGYETEQWKAKLSQFPHNIKVLSKLEMKPIIQYVAEKYGTDYIKLYEGNPHNEKKNSCVICGEPSKGVCCSRSCSGKNVANKTHNKLFTGIFSGC